MRYLKRTALPQWELNKYLQLAVPSITYGTTFAEVAATPAAGQFWPDYSTNADSDKYWNTGKLLFNSSDAGKFIEVGYTATGTLGSIEAGSTLPGWAKYRGDGSEGDFVSDGTVSLSGVHHYTSFMVPAGVSCPIGTDPLIILCQGTVNIAGTLNGKGNTGNCSSQDDTTPEDDIKYSSRAIGVWWWWRWWVFYINRNCSFAVLARALVAAALVLVMVVWFFQAASLLLLRVLFLLQRGRLQQYINRTLWQCSSHFCPIAGAGGAPGSI